MPCAKTGSAICVIFPWLSMLEITWDLALHEEPLLVALYLTLMSAAIEGGHQSPAWKHKPIFDFNGLELTDSRGKIAVFIESKRPSDSRIVRVEVRQVQKPCHFGVLKVWRFQKRSVLLTLFQTLN